MGRSRRRSTEGYKNQSRRTAQRLIGRYDARHTADQPRYLFWSLTTRDLSIKPETRVLPALVATKFERFRGWMLHIVRHMWPASFVKLHKEDKGPGHHSSNDL